MWLGSAWVAMGAVGGVALAQQSSDAETTFARGVAAADAGRWDDAADAFAEVCEVAPTANALLNLATARYHLGQAPAALEVLDRLDQVRGVTEAERRTAKQMRARVQPMVGELSVEVVPAGASVRIDGVGLSEDEPRLYLFPGVHRVSAEAEGHEPGDLELTLEAGERRSVHLQLSVEAPAPPIAAAPIPAPTAAVSPAEDDVDAASDDRSRRKRRWLIAAAVVLVAAGAAGAVAATQAGGGGSAACSEGSAGVALGGCAP